MNSLPDLTEGIVRNRRRAQVRHLLVGCPVMGILYGLACAGVVFLACLVPSPYEFIVVAGIIAVALVGFDSLSRGLQEPVEDAAYRGFTRVYAFPWINPRDRPRSYSAFEPWRTTALVSIILLTADRSAATDLDLWMWWSSLPWLVKGAALGVSVAWIKSIFQIDTWRALRLTRA